MCIGSDNMREKIKQFLSNEYIIKIGYYLLILLMILSKILNMKLSNMDEIWNFSNAKNIIDGLIPYRDFSIIVTPLSQYLNSIFLRLNPTLITFRIIYFLYYIVIVILLDKILDKLNIKKYLKYLFILFFTMMLVSICFLDYNFIQFIIVILLIYLHLKNNEYRNNIINIIIPFLSGLAILNKQSTGMVICIINILLLSLNKYYFKNNIKKNIFFKQIYLTILPILLFILYLLVFNITYDFYDFAIVGLTTFSNNYIDLSLLIYFSLLIIFITFLLFIYKRDNNYFILYFYTIASLSTIIPIVDTVHALFAILLSLLCILYYINDKVKNISNIYVWLIFPLLLIIIVNNINTYIHSSKIEYGIYKNIVVDDSLKNALTEVDNYIINNNKQVLILDYTSTLYNLNMGKYNKYFDLFMNGNFGVSGIKEMKKIIDKDNQIILINNENINWQVPTEIIEYVKDNYNYCGRVNIFAAYCN